ncbi:TPA: magnesium transporter [Vibrio parahaemolyticus]|uniref:magnesium transporter n=1 Tax=Vibrio parahaemolyticus TaxID=670 RepID=UPI00070659C2|nr:magnesium transporter [Vibrio parahaemolyticus]ALG52709.1 Mg/Co/Ni transporter MgtE / CBS domain [Vibrio parahaemolyticus]MBE4029419.1 magnesium transporter [Vibrio parahaemolyticus]MBE4060977.1 magnesium transporter [Vibrio parahaemolyticus]MBE4106890.1 magnesium transporter [Vibrio parahaemolyticus]MBE4121086.1 magnesium transporter [Vibrio parahaemolyticus]
MTVMNNTFIETTPNFSEVEIGAARNAFLKYDQEQQLHLLTIMPIDEAVGILKHCSVGYVNSLMSHLEHAGHDKRARHYAHQLGLHVSEVDTPDGYLSTGVLEHVKQRIGWIIALALLGIVSGLIIAQYEDTLSQLVLLAVYMPVIAAAGGNTGTQAATLVIRALATGELKKRQWLAVLWKESRVALCLALAIAIVMVGRIMLFSAGQSTGGFELTDIALAIAVALFIQVSISTTLGGLLPIIARACKLDPAVLVSPVLASIVDISGMWIYFTVVNYFLGIA